MTKAASKLATTTGPRGLEAASLRTRPDEPTIATFAARTATPVRPAVVTGGESLPLTNHDRTASARPPLRRHGKKHRLTELHDRLVLAPITATAFLDLKQRASNLSEKERLNLSAYLVRLGQERREWKHETARRPNEMAKGQQTSVADLRKQLGHARAQRLPALPLTLNGRVPHPPSEEK